MVSEEGGGRVLPLSDVNYDEYPFSLSFQVLEKYYLILLGKRPMREYVVFFHKHAVYVLALYLVNIYLT